MKTRNLIITTIIILAAIALGVALLRGQGTAPGSTVNANSATGDGYARVEGPLPFDMGTRQGAHPDYQTEWWYYTGNLKGADGGHFGFQLTFFRRALIPPDQRPEARVSDWAFDQVYLAHFALTDVAGNQFHHFEKFGRGAAGIAGAESNPYRVWLENWEVVETAPGTYTMLAAAGDVSLSLEFRDVKGPILQGDRGYSQKGPEPGNASFYFSQTRMEATGEIQTGGGSFAVTGLVWMDHEFSTSALSEGHVGWDWFSMQLDNDTEIMLFYLRRADGTIDPFSSGTVVFPDASTQPLKRADFTITERTTWRSPHSGAVYPSSWLVEIPELNVALEISPWLADQELNNTYAYWEGAVRIQGRFNGEPVTGNGYVEMTGYSGSMAGEF